MSELERMLLGIGISHSDMPMALKNMQDWSQQVRTIESDNNPMASPGTTTAKGVYQFTDDSVTTGLQRLRNMKYPEEMIAGIPINPQEWTDDQADNMFFGNVFAQKGSDPILKEIAMGNHMARRQGYYNFHHTDPDEATISRTEELIPVPNQPVDDLFSNYNKKNSY